MAGDRQGLASAAHGVPERGGGRCRPTFVVSRGMRVSAGEETLGQPLQQGGKRRSRPLPTKAIDEDVGECGSGHHAKGDLARIGPCVQCPAHWNRRKPRDDCRAMTPIFAADVVDENAPSQRVLMADADLWDWSKEQGRPWFAQPTRMPAGLRSSSACSRMRIGDSASWSVPFPIERQLIPHPRPSRFCRTGLLALAPPSA
jgi:hypothetical protein